MHWKDSTVLAAYRHDHDTVAAEAEALGFIVHTEEHDQLFLDVDGHTGTWPANYDFLLKQGWEVKRSWISGSGRGRHFIMQQVTPRTWTFAEKSFLRAVGGSDIRREIHIWNGAPVCLFEPPASAAGVTAEAPATDEDDEIPF